MPRKSGHSHPAHKPQSPVKEPAGAWVDTLLWYAVAATTIVLPCAVSVAGRDEFREPKELILRGSAILIAAIFVLAATFRPAWLKRAWTESKAQITVAAAAVAWTLITTATSSNPALSVLSLVYVVAAALFFIGSCLAIRRLTLPAVYVFLFPAVVNAVVLLLQEFRIWDIYPLDQPSNRSALIGSRDDLGAFLLAPAIAAAVLLMAPGARKALHAGIAALLTIGLLMTTSATAIAAFAAAMLALSVLQSRKKALTAAVIIAFVIAGAALGYPPFRARVGQVRKAIAARDYNALSSYRLTAFIAAAQMVAEHPIMGVGPGCYEWLYFDEKIAAETRHPFLKQSAGRVYNFGEVHCDHLQTLAVSGLPGWLILIGSLVFLASISLRRSSPVRTELHAFAASYSLPLAVGAAILMVAQFPLELAASTSSLLYGAALCATWRPGATD